MYVFLKNKQMWGYHLENGHNTDINNECCFNIESSIVSLNGKAKLYELDGDSNFDPFDIVIALKKIYYYRLILPDGINSNQFAGKIYNDFTIS